MGTRSNTIIRNNGHTIANIYRQFDGYPRGHGTELAAFLASKRITNGISGDSAGTANGLGCLAAQLVAHLKTDVGGIYLTNPDEDNNDYAYIVSGSLGDPTLKIIVLQYGRGVFCGNLAGFSEFCAKFE